jgi:hypothetical protein
MIVLGSRARHAAARLGPAAHDLARAGYHLFHEEHLDAAMDPTASYSPLAMEALQALARTCDETVPAIDGDSDVGKTWREPFSRLSFMTREENGEVFLNWTGSGKFKPWIEKLTQIHTPSVYGGDGASDHLHDIVSLCSDGLATISGGRLVPTNTGRAFLGLIGDSVHDRDLLLRWRQSGDAMAGENDFPAIDRWLASKFRRLKRRVAALPSSPLTEAGHHWRARFKNKLVIRGHRIDASGWSMEERRAITATIRSTNEGVPQREQAMGVIATDDPFEAEDVPVAFWFGKPLGIVPEARGHSWQYNCNLDTTSIDERLIETDRLPIQLRSHEALMRTPAFIAVGTQEDEDEFLTLPHRIPMTNGQMLVPLYFGKVVFPEDASRWRRNAVINGSENQRTRIADRDHSADMSDPIRLIWRYLPNSSEKEEGYLVGMRVGFGVMRSGVSFNRECEALFDVPEATWEMPVTDLTGDGTIADELSRIEAALWCGISRPPRRVTEIRRKGDVITLALN